MKRLGFVHVQVITCADFHPHHCNIFGYSTSKGCIRLADMRAAALCDQHAKMFEDSEPAVGVGFRRKEELWCYGGGCGSIFAWETRIRQWWLWLGTT